ncbi:MAG: hypothetical protein ACXIVQ_07465 [Acidimicrobiales bacterium]
MRSRRRRVGSVIVLVLALTLAACGGDDEADGPTEPIGSVVATTSGWMISHDGRAYRPGIELLVRLVNETENEVTTDIFLAPEGDDAIELHSRGVDAVLSETLAAGEERVVSVTFPTAGRYVAWGRPDPALPLPVFSGFTIAEG